MKERIKELRKYLGLTQAEFASRVSLKQSSIATYEIGRNDPTDAVIALIVREFNVSEQWLRTGEGDMFVTRPPDEELAEIFGILLTDDSPESRIKRSVINSMLRAGPEFWDVIADIAESLAKEKEQDH